MKSIIEKVKKISEHFTALDKTFNDKENYSDPIDYSIYSENHNILELISSTEKLKKANLKTKDGDESISQSFSFVDEIYSENDRQMKLADIIEYILYSRGVYYLFQSDKFMKERVSKFLEINLRIVNILMVYESLTVDKKLRDAFLMNIKSLIGQEKGFNELLNWNYSVGLSNKNKIYEKNAPNLYFDTLLPKTAGGLWHELLVYCFILKYNIGYIFPLLLTQKPISLKHKLSPPDLIILHNKTFRYYGIEIGTLKERQSGGFMAPSGIPIIPIDTTNARVSDRCPSCNKWIGICPKVIGDFCNTEIENTDEKLANEIRCLTECEKYSLADKIDGVCKYMKFKYNNVNWNYIFADGNHHHYHCCITVDQTIKDKIKKVKYWEELKLLNELLSKKILSQIDLIEKIRLQKILKSKYSFIKTHSIFYSELTMLFKMSRQDLSHENETLEEIEDVVTN